MMRTDRQLLAVKDLKKHFPTRHGVLKAVDGVSLDIGFGESVAVVGESGCGKSTLAMSLLGLVPIDSGTITYEGQEMDRRGAAMQGSLAHGIGVVFQNPHSSLNPRMKVRAIVSEPLRSVAGAHRRDLTERVAKLLSEVGLSEEFLYRYPHQLSGGQLQRVAIARALALEPRLIILDEPTAALDVSVQAQILKLLKSLQREKGVSFLLISHNLGAVEYFADWVVVMYLGLVVESGPVREVFEDPRHPYTRALLDAVPTLDPTHRHREFLSGEVPSPLHRPSGCAFSPRCRWSTERCRDTAPERRASGVRSFACFNPLAGQPLQKVNHAT